MRRPPGVVMVSPWISARLDGNEPVCASLVSDDAARTEKIRIERRRVIVSRMPITAGGICLPDLNQSVRHAAPILVDYAARYNDPLSDRRLRAMPRQVVIRLADRVVPIERTGEFTQRVRQLDQRPQRGAPNGRSVAFVQILRLGTGR